MTGDPEENESGVFSLSELIPTFLRRGRKADLTEVSVTKLDQAARERGIQAPVTVSSDGRSIADVSKVVVKGNEGQSGAI